LDCKRIQIRTLPRLSSCARRKLKLELQREQAGRVSNSKLYENSFELLRVRVQRAIGPHNEIGSGNFLFNRPLRGQALIDR
jgi:hypothetical protein